MNKSNRSKVERYIIDVGMRRSLGFDRKTIRKYVALAQRVGVRQGESFPEESDLVERLEALTHSALLRQRPAQELIGPSQHLIEKWLEDKRMTAKQIWRLFREETGLSVSYSTMKRYLRSRFDFGAPRVTVRLEVGPAEQAQVDFGYVGMMVDPSTGKTRRTWALIMTLSYSRHRFVRFVFRQDVPT